MSRDHEQGLGLVELERISLNDIRHRKEKVDDYLLYYWRLYSEFARQRNEIQDSIKEVLTQISHP